MMSVRDILTLAYNICMKSETAARILSLNHQFYQSFAEDFSETRQRLQPGVLQVVDRLPSESSILDVGLPDSSRAIECRTHILELQLGSNGVKGAVGPGSDQGRCMYLGIHHRISVTVNVMSTAQ